jgi:23S rRNA pseudouridine2605 synthase
MDQKRGEGQKGEGEGAPGVTERAHAEASTPKAGERVAKVIARAGLCSRREAEAWIAQGRVALNGTAISSPAVNVRADDTVTVDGKPLPPRERTRLFLYHKPRGLVTTNADPEGRPTIFGALPKNLPRLISVGRLDLSTEGLLLLTNDGGLARVLELPQTGWLRRYRVRAHGRVAQGELDALRAGIVLDGIRYGAIEASIDREQGANVWLTFAIREGKNREVRNVLEHLGLQVNRLIRVSFGPFALGELSEGAIEEVKTRHLREQLGSRIAEAAGAEFSAPMLEREAEAEPRRAPARPPREQRVERPEHGSRAHQRGEDRALATRERRGRSLGKELKQDQKPRKKKSPAGHAWRDADTAPKTKFHGSRRQAPGEALPRDAAKKRSGMVQDRKGRPVLVERFAVEAAKPREARRPARRPAPRDRSRKAGARPSRPRPR